MHDFVSLSLVEKFVPLMERQHVSEVARSPRGFLTAYREAGGHKNRLGPEWVAKREAFIARHMAQVIANDERLFVDGMPTRRHLALLAWAYTPQLERIVRSSRQKPSRS